MASKLVRLCLLAALLPLLAHASVHAGHASPCRADWRIQLLPLSLTSSLLPSKLNHTPCAEAAAALWPFGEAAVLAELLSHVSSQAYSERDKAVRRLLALYSQLLNMLPQLDAQADPGMCAPLAAL